LMQTTGVLSVERDSAGSMVLDRTRVIRDVQAFVDCAPSGGDITLVLNADGQPVATLVVPDGNLQGSPFIPTSVLRLAEGTRLHCDIAMVPQAANTFAGQNLSLLIRT